MPALGTGPARDRAPAGPDLGRARAGDRPRPRREGPGTDGRAGQRHPRPRPGLRRHPRARRSCTPRPRSSRPRWPPPRRAARAAASCSPRSRSATRSASGWATPATTRRSTTRSSSSAACTPPRSAGRSARPPRRRRVMGLPEDQIAHAMGIAALDGRRPARGQPRRRLGQAHALRLGRPLRRGRRRSAPPPVSPVRRPCSRAGSASSVPTAVTRTTRPRCSTASASVWATRDCFVKPYPTNVFTHSGIDAALALRATGPPARGDRVGRDRRPLAGAAHDRPAARGEDPPASRATTRSSPGPFTFAIALGGGGGLGVYLDDFTDERVADPVLLDLAARVTHVGDPRCDEIFPQPLPLDRAGADEGRHASWSRRCSPRAAPPSAR